MKRSLFLFCVMINFATHAQVNLPDKQSVSNYLQGVWEWQRSCGGIAGLCKTPATEGYTQRVYFIKYAQPYDTVGYQYHQNGSMLLSSRTGVSFSGTLALVSELKNFTGAITNTLSIYAQNSDTLFLNDYNASDGYVHKFYKVQNPTGIAEIKQNVRLYPNPTNGLVVFESEMPDSVIVFDTSGRQFILPSDGKTLDLGELAAGIYFIQVPIGEQNTVLKILKLGEQ